MADSTRYDPPRPIRGWTIDATCLSCGGVRVHRADGHLYPNASRALAICTACGCEWHVEVTMRPTGAVRRVA